MGACASCCIKSNPQSNYIMSATDLLEKIDPKTVPKVPFQDKIIHARIEEIYDGDTVTKNRRNRNFEYLKYIIIYNLFFIKRA
jgi:hypothetical protein